MTALNYISKPTDGAKAGAKRVIMIALDSQTEGLASQAKSIIGALTDKGIDDNPLFEVNGIDGPSPITDAWAVKTFGNKALSFFGSKAAKLLPVNPIKAGKHVRSGFKTGRHIQRFKAMAPQFESSRDLSRRLAALIELKERKLATRVGHFGASFVPFGGGFASAAIDAVNAGLNASVEEQVLNIAYELHWRAYREQKLARGGKGPAMRMIRELYRQGFGSEHAGENTAIADGFILEPKGWKPIFHKMSSM